ncbi:Coiled-coil domain-containing protein 39, partial [Frankliniella fusca]
MSPSKPPAPVTAGPPSGPPPAARGCRDPRGGSFPLPRPGPRPGSALTALTRDSLEGSAYVPAPRRLRPPGGAQAAPASAAVPGDGPLKSSNG